MKPTAQRGLGLHVANAPCFSVAPRSNRVQACVNKLTQIARNASSADEARKVAMRHEDLTEFSRFYRVMFTKLCEPSIAGNPDHVATIYAMIDIHSKMTAGLLTPDAARTQASDTALAGLMKQTPQAPRAPSPSTIEELD